jgi:hypothetical protein
LLIDVEPELRRRIELAASERNVSVRDFVANILRRAVETHDDNNLALEAMAWRQASASSFAREWDSDEDAVYDHLS